MFFSVILSTFNRADTLHDCLNCLANQSIDQRDFEVIVVDDGSTDHTKAVAEEFSKKIENFEYLYQKNQGQGIGRNNALKIAKGQVVVLIGDDILVSYDFLYEHQKYHYLYPEEYAAVLGFTAWHPKLKITNFMKWMTNGSAVLGKFGGQQFAYEKLQGKKMANYNFFYTSNISIKKSLLEKYHFDPIFSGYGWEDIELGYRLEKMAGLKIYYNSWAIAYHDHPIEEKDFMRRMQSVGKSAYLFHKKYPELHKVPGLMKLTVFKIISNPMTIALLKMLKKMSNNNIYSFYYYAISKKYFLQGLKMAVKHNK
jgi:glycosyltransferase involved in cell wall biosynthesis